MGPAAVVSKKKASQVVGTKRGRQIVYSSEDDEENVNHKRVKSAAGCFYYNSTIF